MNKIKFIFLFAFISLSVSFAQEDSLIARVKQVNAEVLRQPKIAVSGIDSAEEALRIYDFANAIKIISSLNKNIPLSERQSLNYRWLFITENLKSADSLINAALKKDSKNSPSLLAQGELNYKLIKYDESLKDFDNALKLKLTPKQKSQAVVGIAKILYKKSKYQ